MKKFAIAGRILARDLDLPFSGCQTLIATHADVNHVQGLAQIKSILRCAVSAHKLAAVPLSEGDRIKTFALIEAQGVDLEMPPVEIDHLLNDGDSIELGRLKLDGWLRFKSRTNRYDPGRASQNR